LIIEKFEYFNTDHLVERLRKMHIKGRPDLTIYRDARITLEEDYPIEQVVFPQYYVLEKDLEEITLCRRALMEYGVDIFRLRGFVRVWSRRQDNGQMQVFDVTPPVVEISQADGGIPLLNDGMHRLYLARQESPAMNLVIVEGVDPRYPYYALPNEGGWDSLQRCREVPDIKKNYRIADYKSLFRDFNTCFLNVTQPRTTKKIDRIKVQGQQVAQGR